MAQTGMNRADILNQERWAGQRAATTNGKLDRIIHLLEILVGEQNEDT